MRVVALFGAVWFGVFALAHLVQIIAAVVPDSLQPALSTGWAVYATIIAAVICGAVRPRKDTTHD